MIQVKKDFGEFSGVSLGHSLQAGAPQVYHHEAKPKPPDDDHVPVLKSNLTQIEIEQRKNRIDKIFFLACSEWSTDERLLYEQKIRYLNMSLSEVNLEAHTWLAKSCLGGIRLVFELLMWLSNQYMTHVTRNVQKLFTELG